MPIGTATQFLEALTEQSEQVVFVYDVSANHFYYLNPAFEKIWRKKRKSVQHNPEGLFKMVHPEDQQHVRESYQEILDGIIIHDIEFRIKLRNHTERWVCVKPLLLEDHSVITGYVNDITVQKLYNDNLKKYSDKKNSILNILSHDLAGPLSMIGNMAEVLKSDLKSHQNQDVHNLIGLIQKSSQQGVRLIQEFIKQEFLESTGVGLIKRRVNLVQTLRISIEEYQQTQQMTRKMFYYQTSSENIFLNLDDNKFMQAINNLISNAIKFTPDGGEITVTVEDGDDAVLIKIADNGIGIPAVYHKTLFEKFTRASRPGLKGEPSIGLGMSIVKTIVEWHQGQIWFESQENKGSTFFIQMPK